MKHAIAHLEIAMTAARTNEPIHRAGGDRKQANLCKQVAWDCLEAIQILKTVIAERKAAAKKSNSATP